MDNTFSKQPDENAMRKRCFRIEPGGKLLGELRVPGDKSISHRAVMLGSLAHGRTEVNGFLEGEDSLATLNAFRDLGVKIEGPDEGKVCIHGVGMHGLTDPAAPLSLGNSGTSMRLLSGLFAGCGLTVTLVGDRSLSSRPMKRVIDPLTQMGALITAQPGGQAPLVISAGSLLKGIHYRLPMASAQVKSAVLLAGLYAQGQTCVTEPVPTRDHTERMLRGFGYAVQRKGDTVCLLGGGELQACTIDIPADISSATFFLVGASIAQGSEMVLKHVGINPTRDGVITLLRLMGAHIELLNTQEIGGEPVADIRVSAQGLRGIDIPEELVPLAIDEFPALFIAAACAEGVTRLRGARELRVKESDRIQVMADGLQVLGIQAEPTEEGICITGGQMRGGRVDSQGDHRIAMSFAMAGLRASDPIEISDIANVDTSFPGFLTLASGAGLQIQEVSSDG
jgi:3-phosphoshikimate 1-carboxyvinyltransferase